MKKWLEKQFQLSSYGTNVKTELLAGLTTFVTMAYVLATVPSLLGNAGLDRNVMFTAMILLSILTTCAMSFYTNRPFALAPGLGSVGIVASMISNEGISAPVAAGSSGTDDSGELKAGCQCRHRTLYCSSWS